MSAATADWAEHWQEDEDEEEEDEVNNGLRFKKVCADGFFLGAVPVLAGSASFLSDTTSHVNERNALSDLAIKKAERAEAIAKQQTVVHSLVLQNTITDVVSSVVVEKNKIRKDLSAALKKTSFEVVHDKLVFDYDAEVKQLENQRVAYLRMFRYLHKERPEQYATRRYKQTRLFDEEEEEEDEDEDDKKKEEEEATSVIKKCNELSELHRDLVGFFRVLSLKDNMVGYEEAVNAAITPNLPSAARSVIAGPIQLQKRDDWLFRSMELGPVDDLESAMDCDCFLCRASHKADVGFKNSKRKLDEDSVEMSDNTPHHNKLLK